MPKTLEETDREFFLQLVLADTPERPVPVQNGHYAAPSAYEPAVIERTAPRDLGWTETDATLCDLEKWLSEPSILSHPISQDVISAAPTEKHSDESCIPPELESFFADMDRSIEHCQQSRRSEGAIRLSFPLQTEKTPDVSQWIAEESESHNGRPHSVEQSSKRRRAYRYIGNIFFYGVLIFILAAFILQSADGNPKRGLFGYSVFEILSGSMQSEIPKGSLILTKYIEPSDIQVGDDITFLKDRSTKVTHRVVRIIENYDDRALGFETMGIENPLPDDQIVHQNNILGKVVWHIAGAGDTLAYLKENWLIVVLPIAGLIGVVILLKFIFKKNEFQNNKTRRVMRGKAVTS